MNVPLTPVRFLRYSEEQFPRKTAVVCQDLRFTYAEFGDRVGRLAGALRRAGVKRGDRVAFLSLNCHRLLEAYYGVLEAGGILLPLNIRLAAPELVYILNHSGAAVLFLEQEFVGLVDSFRRDLQTVRSFYQLDGTPQANWLSDQTYEQALVSATPFREELMAFDENSVAEIFYTSGTSASPKGVMLTHRNVYLHAMNLAVYHHTRYEDVLMHTIPLFHANGWGAAHTITSVGGTHVMLPRFVPEEVFRLVERERVSALSLVPAMATALVNCPHAFQVRPEQRAVVGNRRRSFFSDSDARGRDEIGIQMFFGLRSDGVFALVGHRRTEARRGMHARGAVRAAGHDRLCLSRVMNFASSTTKTRTCHTME